ADVLGSAAPLPDDGLDHAQLVVDGVADPFEGADRVDRGEGDLPGVAAADAESGPGDLGRAGDHQDAGPVVLSGDPFDSPGLTLGGQRDGGEAPDGEAVDRRADLLGAADGHLDVPDVGRLGGLDPAVAAVAVATEDEDGLGMGDGTEVGFDEDEDGDEGIGEEQGGGDDEDDLAPPSATAARGGRRRNGRV